MNCRFCGTILKYELIDLGYAPPSNAFLSKDQLKRQEIHYPLKLFVCENCFLVQIDEYKKSREIFNAEYFYFSSFSKSWLDHAKNYAAMMINGFGYDCHSRIIEIASNDGYLLQFFKERGISTLGIEPAAGTAVEAQKKGIETIVDFFTKDLARSLAEKGRKADLLIGNNVLAHIPDLNDFVTGLKMVLEPAGIITMEFPHLMQIIEHGQFDTIYHEHYSYFSLMTVNNIFRKHGLEIFDVQKLPTHGGSLRIFAHHAEDRTRQILEGVFDLVEEEISKGLNSLSYYEHFQKKADQVKYDLLEFLIQKKIAGCKVAAYGAAAKGNTLLNYCGIKKDLVPFVVDASPHKQGRYLPGSHIPVLSENEIMIQKPDFILIMPWNIKEEIMAQLAYVRRWGGRFVIPIPCLTVN
jgi:2-polyprenyl-3-methyl-5-hydroxy-6-metoxy-1,4-benzoquinol methylase